MGSLPLNFAPVSLLCGQPRQPLLNSNGQWKPALRRRIAAVPSGARRLSFPLAAPPRTAVLCCAVLCCAVQLNQAQSSTKWKEEREAKREAEWDSRLKEAYK